MKKLQECRLRSQKSLSNFNYIGANLSIRSMNKTNKTFLALTQVAGLFSESGVGSPDLVVEEWNEVGNSSLY